ncbi:MAG: hypothetical protein AAFR35_07850 [Pseudomonadota bacterium]
MSTRWGDRLFGGGALLGCWFLFFAALNGTPAFQPALRDTGGAGSWHVEYGPAQYHTARYLYQRGYARLQGDADPTRDWAQQDASRLGSVWANPDLAEEAVALFQASLDLSPGRAAAWTQLGWAHALSGDIPKSWDALHTSWSRAPYNRAEAPERIALAVVLWRMSADPVPPGTATSLARDLATLEHHAPDLHRAVKASTPGLDGIAEAEPEG